jgi:hypothetical protein
MNLNDDVVYRCLRLGALHQRHPGRSRSLFRHHDRLHVRLPVLFYCCHRRHPHSIRGGHIAKRGRDPYCIACERDLEGIVAKSARGRCQSDGRSTSWLKIKNETQFPSFGAVEGVQMQSEIKIGQRFQFSTLSDNPLQERQAVVTRVLSNREEGLGSEADYYFAYWVEAYELPKTENPTTLVFERGNDGNVYLDGRVVTITLVK